MFSIDITYCTKAFLFPKKQQQQLIMNLNEKDFVMNISWM